MEQGHAGWDELAVDPCGSERGYGSDLWWEQIGSRYGIANVRPG